MIHVGGSDGESERSGKPERALFSIPGYLLTKWSGLPHTRERQVIEEDS